MKWVRFNYPLQSDVLIASLGCRRAFNKWKLLGEAMGRGTHVVGSKKDVQLRQVKSDGRMFIPSIRMADGSIYYPPVPPSCWSQSKFQITSDGELCFPEPRVARGYTIITFLLDRHKDGMERWFNEVLLQEGIQYSPHRLKISTRRRDPKKMVVFYDNDKREIEPLAVCMQINMVQGAFALVDDFGRILQDTTHYFKIDN
jgi:hypothetical protein